MIRSFFEKLPKSARGWGVWGFTALMVLGVLRIYGLAGTVDMQNAAGAPGMPTSALLLHLAFSVCLILAGKLGRKYCLRAKRRDSSASAFSAALPR